MAQSNWEADKKLDVYIHDYLLKRKLHNSAKAFMTEGKDATDPVVGPVAKVRAPEIDKVDLLSSFRPGDIVKALVLSLGDARAYYLSTAKNELGVLSAESMAGGTMVPISWTEMQCPLTGQVEPRKVAKVGS